MTLVQRLENKISTGFINNPYAGGLMEVFEEELPPANVSKSSFLNINRRLNYLQGDYNGVKLKIKNRESLNDVSSSDLHFESTIQNKVQNQKQKLIRRDLFNNHNGNLPENCNLNEEQPFDPARKARFFPLLSENNPLSFDNHFPNCDKTQQIDLQKKQFSEIFNHKPRFMKQTRKPLANTSFNNVEPNGIVALMTKETQKPEPQQNNYSTISSHPSSSHQVLHQNWNPNSSELFAHENTIYNNDTNTQALPTKARVSIRQQLELTNTQPLSISSILTNRPLHQQFDVSNTNKIIDDGSHQNLSSMIESASSVKPKIQINKNDKSKINNFIANANTNIQCNNTNQKILQPSSKQDSLFNRINNMTVSHSNNPMKQEYSLSGKNETQSSYSNQLTLPEQMIAKSHFETASKQTQVASIVPNIQVDTQNQPLLQLISNPSSKQTYLTSFTNLQVETQNQPALKSTLIVPSKQEKINEVAGIANDFVDQGHALFAKQSELQGNREITSYNVDQGTLLENNCQRLNQKNQIPHSSRLEQEQNIIGYGNQSTIERNMPSFSSNKNEVKTPQRSNRVSNTVDASPRTMYHRNNNRSQQDLLYLLN